MALSLDWLLPAAKPAPPSLLRAGLPPDVPAHAPARARRADARLLARQQQQ